jgi:energy-coupling factor transporter ATP-binding protein EcfA2
MRLTRLELNDIGPFQAAVFEIPAPAGPGELVLFEGPNGCGKTTILQTIALMVSGYCARLDPSILLTNPPLAEWLRRRGATPLGGAQIAHDGAILDLKLGSQAPDQSAGAGANAAADALHFFQSAARTPEQPITWAAFAHGPHAQSADLRTAGPREIEEAPLRGALSFGAQPASALLGQLLANLENDRTKALAYASEGSDPERREELSRIASSRRAAIGRFERVLSSVLQRRVTIEFAIDRQAPMIRLDGEELPLDLLGEGIRSTFSWLSDLLVRLERVIWADITRAPIDQEFWLILDEIEESLHPTMQARLLPALRELFPRARIYAATHSPFIVASAAEGVVFPIRPGKDHRVRGTISARQLEPGQSLEWVVTEIFQAQSGFVDQKTRDLLADHKRDVRRFERTGNIDWNAFFARRSELMALNDEVRTVVAMQEIPVRPEVDRRMLDRAEAREQATRT